MKKISFVNGSPSGKRATSLILLKDIASKINGSKFEKTFLSLHLKRNGNNSTETLENLANSDAIIFAFPLYAYTMPSALTKLMIDFHEYIKEKGLEQERINIYAYVNSGYSQPFVNEEALRVMRNYCKRTGLQWRFGVQIGGGLLVAMMRNVPLVNLKLRKTYKMIQNDILSPGEKEIKDVQIKPIIPKFMTDYLKDSPWSKKFMEKRMQKSNEV